METECFIPNIKDKKFAFEDRLVDNTASLILFYKYLPNDMTGRYYGNQLLNSGGCSALNFSGFQATNTEQAYFNMEEVSPKE